MVFNCMVVGWTSAPCSEVITFDRVVTAAFNVPGALEGAPPEKPFVPGLLEIPPSLQGDIGEQGWKNSVR